MYTYNMQIQCPIRIIHRVIDCCARGLSLNHTQKKQAFLFYFCFFNFFSFSTPFISGQHETLNFLTNMFSFAFFNKTHLLKQLFNRFLCRLEWLQYGALGRAVIVATCYSSASYRVSLSPNRANFHVGSSSSSASLQCAGDFTKAQVGGLPSPIISYILPVEPILCSSNENLGEHIVTALSIHPFRICVSP